MSGVDERVERARALLVSGLNIPPRDCTNHCGDGPCDCSGEWRVQAYSVESVNAALDSLAAAVAGLEQRADPELPEALAARVATWLTANEVGAEAVRWGRFPLGMVNLWIERALHTERSNDPDYSPAYQDQYQRLWHEAAARAVAAEQRAAEAEKALREIAEDYHCVVVEPDPDAGMHLEGCVGCFAAAVLAASASPERAET